MISIHNHDMYSFLDGFGTPEEMLKKADEVGLKGFAITNHGNQFSWVYYHLLKEKYPNLKMIYGVEMYECFDKTKKDSNSKYFHLVVLARNEAGRIGLNKLVKKSNFEGFYYKPRIELSDLKEYANDLVISSACLGSKIAKASGYAEAKEFAQEYKDTFPYFFLEMQSHNNETQIEYNKTILKLSKELDIPYLITTDSHRARKEELPHQTAISRIGNDSQTFGEIYDDCYIQSEQETIDIMDSYLSMDEIQKAFDNSDTLLDIIDDVQMPFQEPKLPHFSLPKGYDEETYLMKLCEEGILERGFNLLSNEEYQIRIDRMNYEYNVIKEMGFPGYFLIVWDFINFAKSKNIAVGAGRGSAAGSMVAYLLGITDIDPITHGLIFERFLNPERISYPDIDVDVSDRETVIQYLESKYGKDSVCQVANFSYITPKVAIKDTAKVLRKDPDNEFNLTVKESDMIAKLFMAETFEDCINTTSKLKVYEKEYEEWFSMARSVSGRVKNTSIHACAIGIVDAEITDYMGMFKGGSNENVIQVDKRILERIGIVKMDLLGVTTLSVVQEVLNLIGKDKDIINPNRDDFLNNKKMFELLQKADTIGVFQVESYGMQELLRGMLPNSIGDISAVLALYRPDTMSMIDDYIERKHGRKEVSYIHEDMKPILEKDYGCLIYQEQLLEIVKVFGGRTYGGADLFRKGIGKKDKKLVMSEAKKMYQEIIDNNYSEEIASIISKDLSEKGGYSFNKSHSLGYAVLTLQTAYLKANYPLEFMTALLNSCVTIKDSKYKMKYKKLTKYVVDARNRGINVIPPKINKAKELFSINNNDIVFGLMLVKDIGQSTVDPIINERNFNGDFKSFEDFVNRVNPKNAELVSLTKAGSFCSEEKKESLIKHIFNITYEPIKLKLTEKSPAPQLLKEKTGIEISSKEDNYKEKRLEVYNKFQKKDYYEKEIVRKNKFKLAFDKKHLSKKDFWEYSKLSMFISHNPLEKYNNLAKRFSEVNIGDRFLCCGMISSIDKKTNKNKAQFAFIEFYTDNDMVELISWHDSYKQYSDIIIKGTPVVAIALKNADDKMTLQKMKTLDQWLVDMKAKGKI